MNHGADVDAQVATCERGCRSSSCIKGCGASGLGVGFKVLGAHKL